MSSVTFSLQAYVKILLHAIKYPHCAINGLLLSSKSAQKKEVEIVDVVPLFHIALNLTPMAEIALIQVDEIASKKDLAIAGYYTASDIGEVALCERPNHRILDRLPQNVASHLLVMLDNSKINFDPNNIAIKVAQYDDNLYIEINSKKVVIKDRKSLELASNLLENGIHKSLVDFDNHLDNVALDWMNPEVNKAVQGLLSDVVY